MSNRLAVDEREGLKELRPGNPVPQPAGIRAAAKFFSYLFHPVFVPVLVVWFMLYIHPYLFAGQSPFDKVRIMMMAVLMYTLFPVVTVLMLKALKFIQNIHLETQKDRIIPIIACMTWYGWLAYVWWNSHKMNDSIAVPKEAFRLTLGIFLASWLALMANIRIKISLHAISVGVMLTFIILLALSQDLNFGIYISVALLITGITCTSRFLVSDHGPGEVYGGLAVGALAMLVANQFG